MNQLKTPPLMRPEFSPLSIARTLWKGKLLVVVTWAVVSAGSYVYVSRIPPTYYAEALVAVDPPKISDKIVSSTVSTTTQDRLNTINRQILTSSSLTKIAEEVKLFRSPGGELAPEWLLGMMRANLIFTLDRGWTGERSGAFKVGFVGSDPRITADVANRVALLYVEENMKTREIQAEGTSEFIDAQLQDAKQKLDRLETMVSRYKIEHNGELPQQENALIGMLGRLQTDLHANNDAMNRAQENKSMLENSLHVAEATITTLSRASSSGAQDTPSVIPLDAGPGRPPLPPRKSELLQAELNGLRLRYSEEHPDIKRLKESILVARATEAGEAVPEPTPSNPRPAAPAAPKTANLADAVEIAKTYERISGFKQQIAAAEKELLSRTQEQERIRREIARLQSKVEYLPIREQEMGQMMRDYDMTKGNYQQLLGKKLGATMATDLERNQKSERFTIVEPAHVPLTPFKPNRRVMYLSGFCIALLVGLAAAMGNEMRRNVLLGEWELPTGTAVLGSLPKIEIEAREDKPRRSFWSRTRATAGSSVPLFLMLARYLDF